MSTPGDSRPAAKPQRILSCVLCQQRKIKCDRKSPCGNCLRAGADCVLATRQRRRRFAERDLLERLRHYEDLLRHNHIPFQPLHPPPDDDPTSPGGSEPTSHRSELEQPPPDAVSDPSVKTKTKRKAEAADRGLGQDVSQAVITTAWNQMYQSEPGDYLLFGHAKTNIDLAAIHPDQAQIFRLWQIYLDNVDPLLKITHTPTLQSRIIDAAADIAQVPPALEALMFSIYCMALLSLSDDACQRAFGASRKEQLATYQVACQQALRGCDIFRAADRDSLTALLLYLVSIREEADPRTLSSMLAIAIRIAHRMGLHREPANARCLALEGEMRRRLWWSLIMFDSRICEIFDYRAAPLDPTWDCQPPVNIHDFDLRPEMKKLPAGHDRPTEAIFTVVRSEVTDFIRHSSFHLDLTNPLLHRLVDRSQNASDLSRFEHSIEQKFLNSCSLDNPLQYMTLWTARGSLAKSHLLDYYTQRAKATTEPTETGLDWALNQALSIIQSDTRLMASSLTVGYRWFLLMYFPLPAYVHILQDLRKRPGKRADSVWEAMGDNYEARKMSSMRSESPIFVVFSRLVLQAWEARETASPDQPLQPPQMVVDVRRRILQMQASFPREADKDPTNGNATSALATDNGPLPMPANMPANIGSVGQGVAAYEPELLASTRTDPLNYASLFGAHEMGVDLNQLYLSPMDWIFAQP
ncbi:Zn(II)2Cys6 transcription factor [Aspergillus homomorphus CBS 101889]|uniref:Zn(2)-C6 fungal-type domain-containing protein n=1 Tax=Aspergillus homomorphus (strain CBS 101889) TaxID=1450537 RepID=A0A395HXE9_ASPHC|nr:hypothetical protein BO97DRAFT_344127 [Aspergillus homomorphus CBS 101889]RAL12591.1 hypothetical protein BO97DRAFT_344127 [Aspergillus homomorphus CBS 101889]